jgi:hypothetical protein
LRGEEAFPAEDKRHEQRPVSDKKKKTPQVNLTATTLKMSLKSIALTTMAVVASASAAGWGGPDMHTTCTDCTNAGMTWQPEANKCTGNCDIKDITCLTTPAECNPQPIYPPVPEPIYPPTRPFDCYVDLRGSNMPWINIWRKKPCGKYGSFGALYQGRGLYYVRNAHGDVMEWPRDVYCGGDYRSYIKMSTASGKSVGWVAEDMLVCVDHNKYPTPPPAPAPTGPAYSKNNKNA